VEPQREAGVAARFEVAPRLRGVERAALEEDVRGGRDLCGVAQHVCEREVEICISVLELGRHRVRAEPGRHKPPAARIACSDASSVSRSSP